MALYFPCYDSEITKGTTFNTGSGVPTVAQQKRNQPGSLIMQPSLSGLRIQRCCEVGCSYSSDLTPSLRTSIFRECGPKRKTKQNKKPTVQIPYLKIITNIACKYCTFRTSPLPLTS